MEILKTAMAGTLESSDAQVTVEPGDNGIELMHREQRDPSVLGDRSARWPWRP